MTGGNEFEKFFNGHAPVYMENRFTSNTLAEVDFLLEEFKLPSGSAILDIGCGTGRHSVELAKRGYSMTGVDLSSGMLAEAKKAADAAGVTINLIQSDATKFTTLGQFDAAICLCEGSFGLLGTGDDPIEHDLSILQRIHGSLKPDAKLIVTVLNGCRFIRTYSQKDVEEGKFDPLTMSEHTDMEADTPEGKQTISIRERGYVPTELAILFRLAGFKVENLWGGTAGNWGHRPLDLDEMEIMAVARKSASAEAK